MGTAPASTTWTSEQLDVFGNAEEIRILTQHRDGTMRAPVNIWIVRVDGELFVRSSHGRESNWCQGAATRHQAVIRAAGHAQRVGTADEVHRSAEIDAAYRAKYARYATSFLPALLSEKARGATLRLVPIAWAGGA